MDTASTREYAGKKILELGQTKTINFSNYSSVKC